MTRTAITDACSIVIASVLAAILFALTITWIPWVTRMLLGKCDLPSATEGRSIQDLAQGISAFHFPEIVALVWVLILTPCISGVSLLMLMAVYDGSYDPVRDDGKPAGFEAYLIVRLWALVVLVPCQH